jgi:hypothetical protein
MARKSSPTTVETDAAGITEKAAKRNRSAVSNAALDIDFTAGKTANEIASEQAQTRSLWINKLIALRDGVLAGRGDYDTFYRIGEFTTGSGARSVITALVRRPERLPGEFALEPRRVRGVDGTRTSELWAAVPSDAYEAELDDAA